MLKQMTDNKGLIIILVCVFIVVIIVVAVVGIVLYNKNKSDEEETKKVPMDKLAVYELSAGETMTMNFKGGEDGKAHYLVTAVSISMNKESDGYKKYGETISEKESIIKGEVSNIVSQYTMEEYQVDAAGIRSEIVKGLQEMFESDFIVDVTFSEPIYQ